MILVTGGTGLVGSQLLLDLLLKGETVRALKRKNSDLSFVINVFSAHAGLLEKIEWVDGDVLDIFSLDEAFKEINKVYHCAAFVSFILEEAGQMFQTNITGTANMVNKCLENKIEKLCYVSSVAAINRINESEIIDENADWTTSNQHSNYAISKYGAEREVWRGMAEGLNAVIVNPTIIIGPGNWQTGSTALFSEVWKGLKFYTEGTTGFVDVRDVTKCMIALINSPVSNERFIINAENLSYRQIVNWISDDMNKKHPAIHANKFLRSIAWRNEALKKIIFRTRPFITKETARSAGIKVRFSNKKIKETITVDFIPIKKAVEDTCKIFLRGVI